MTEEETREKWSDWACHCLHEYPRAPAKDKAAFHHVASTGATAAPRLRRRYAREFQP